MSTERTSRKPWKSLVFGGILPIAVFYIMEEKWGVVWGVIGGIIFSVGEVSYEWFRFRKIEKITWMGSLLFVITGAVSLITQDGIWYKLQPALFAFVFGCILVGSYWIKKPFLVMLLEKQKEEMKTRNIPPVVFAEMEKLFSILSFRLGVFFFFQTGIAVWSALSWPTSYWALWKGVGVTVSLLVYLFLEILIFRMGIKKRLQ